jgi:ribosomal protein S13
LELKLQTLLPMIPGVGKARAHEIIEAMDCSPLTRVKALSAERRHDLAMVTRGAREAYVA